MKLQRAAWLTVGAALVVISGCREEAVPERERGKEPTTEAPETRAPLMGEQDRLSFVDRSRERLDAAARTIQRLETDLDERMKNATEAAKTRSKEAQEGAEGAAAELREKAHDAWEKGLDGAKDTRSDIASKLDDLAKASADEFNEKRQEVDNELRKLEGKVDEISEEMRQQVEPSAPQKIPEVQGAPNAPEKEGKPPFQPPDKAPQEKPLPPEKVEPAKPYP